MIINNLPNHTKVFDNDFGALEVEESTGIMFGDKLMLQATSRRLENGRCDYMGTFAHYWSSTATVFFGAYSLDITKTHIGLNDDWDVDRGIIANKQLQAMPFRCIKCLPDERKCHRRR